MHGGTHSKAATSLAVMQAPATWRPRGAGGRSSAPAATAATATQGPPAATVNVASTAAEVKPPIPAVAPAKQEGKPHKKSGLSIKLSLGGKKVAAPASGTDVSETAQQPLAFFGKQVGFEALLQISERSHIHL